MPTNAINERYVNAATGDIKLEVTPVAGRIGAIINNVRIDDGIDDATFAEIEKALIRHKVIFFRGQQHLDDDEQERFAARFGEIIAHPTVPTLPGTKTILELNSERGAFANSWHTDVTFIPDYPKISVLRSVIIPEAGGDTIWANGETAYDDLSPELRNIVQNLKAIHTNKFDYAEGTTRFNNRSAKELEQHRAIFASTEYETEHPVVRLHPVSGKPSLLLGHFFKRFTGLSTTDSLKLFDILQNLYVRPENTVRWNWQVGDVAIWDNRATQHYAIADYGSQHRVVRRVTVRGEIPLGIDGFNSRQLQLEPAANKSANSEIAQQAAI